MGDFRIGLMVAGVGFEALVGEVLGSEDGLHGHPFSSLNVGEPVVTNVEAVCWFFFELIEEGLIGTGVGFDPADFSGDDDSVEVWSHA